MNDLICKLSRVINAPIDKVFDAWLDPQLLARFMLPMPGMPQPKTEVDGRVGGRFTIHMDVGEKIIPHSGTYLELDRPNRLVFSWESPFSTDGSTVTLEFTAQDKAKTRLELTHVRFIDEETRDNHEIGWGNILAALDDLS
ncbi:MAG: SRPBCC domain-containing protein [Proteobacteria bacterium]|nr:SRPBCC domain-containing protein [Pseudomonadota bacterium]